MSFMEFDINTIVNFLFTLTLGWVMAIDARLRAIPDKIHCRVEASSQKLSHRMDRIEDKLDAYFLKIDKMS